MLGMADEPRILVYEGRRFLRPEIGPRIEGAKDAGFENLPRLALASIGTAVFMIGSGVWFANKLRSGEIPWDSPWKWFALVFTLGPMILFMGLAVVGARMNRPIEKPKFPPNPVRLSWGFQPSRGRTNMSGSLELEHGLIRIRNDEHLIEINRLEIDQIKIVEGRVRLRVPKFHALPTMYILLCPINREYGNLSVQRSALKELVRQVETMPTSALPSTYPTIERREFERPSGTFAKCIFAGILVGLCLMLLVRFLPRPDGFDRSGEVLGWVLMPICVSSLISVMAFSDVLTAKSENKWLRKKGIIRD